jgi:hypothetical protein
MFRTEAEQFYQLSQENNLSSRYWQLSRKTIKDEISDTRGARTHEDSIILENAQKKRVNITSLYAAELFPDSDPPQLVIAEKESETHEDLREKNPSSAPRISGELFRLKGDLTCRFFQMDSINLSRHLINVLSERKLPEIIDWLFNQNIVPVDAENYIISQEILAKAPE